MYFFKIEISSFDDAAKTLFVIPEQNADEKGVPFEEKMLTQTADFKQFVKATQTCMVDGKYTQYKTAEVLDSLDEKRFEQLKAEGRIEELDGNTFSISTGFSPKKGGKGKPVCSVWTHVALSRTLKISPTAKSTSVSTR